MDEVKKYEPLFGSWTVDRVIGTGSFGKVYALKKTDFGKQYFSALKVISIPQSQSEISSLRSEGMDDQSIKIHYEQFVANVVSEFDLMSRFRGTSNIVSYEDHMVILHEDGFGYDIMIRMELLQSLVKLLEQNRFSKKDIIQLGIDMCKALELCQKHNVIHRDIKPENIFVSDHGDYKLGDFGIARTMETTSGEMSKKGTYTYMAPEVYKGEAYSSDVDIYSLGIVMYRLLNGNRTPFLPPAPAPITHTDRENALMRRMSGEKIPPPVSAEGRLAEIVMKCVEYNPRDRFISPMQMRKELENIMYTQGEGQLIYPMGDRVELPASQSVDKTEQNTSGTGRAEVALSDESDKTVYMPVEKAPVEDMDKTVADISARGAAYVPPMRVPPPKKAKKSRLKRVIFPVVLCFILLIGVGAWIFIPKLFPGKGEDITTDVTDKNDEKYGNTSGNISNYGLAAQSGDWVYYRNDSDSGNLYKMRTDGTDRTKLNDDNSYYINVIGDWIYYNNNSDDNKLYKIRTDGTDRTKLNDDESFYINVIGDWVYYCNWSDNFKLLYKICTDGTGKTKLNDDNSGYINVIGDWVYYSNNSDDNKLYKIRTDGTERTKLSDHGSEYINVIGDWVYYISTSDNNKPYKIRTDGNDRTKLSDEWYNSINVADDWIYYSSWDESDRLYKMHTDGTGKTKLNDERTGYINIIGDWVYYRNESDGGKLYKIRSDGTQRLAVDGVVSTLENQDPDIPRPEPTAPPEESKENYGVYFAYILKLHEVSDAEGYIIAKYESISGENYTDDFTMYSVVVSDIIPATETFLSDIKNITSESTELQNIHKLYISAWEKQYEAFKLLVTAVEKGDSSMVDSANDMLNEAQKLSAEYLTALENYAKKFE